MRFLRFLELGLFFALLAVIYTQIIKPVRDGRTVFPALRRRRRIEEAVAKERQGAELRRLRREREAANNPANHGSE